MEQIRKTVVGVYHVFGHQAKIAVILDVNADEEYFVCDMLNGVETVLAAGKKVPFWQAPFELSDAEKIDMGLMPDAKDVEPEKEEPKAGPKSAEKKPVEKKPEAKPAPKKSAPKGKVTK